MKRLILFKIFIITCFFTKAQDTIIKRDGERINAKVIEVNTNDIRYKKIENIDGPIYRIEKDQLNYIIYLNGSKDEFNKYIAPVSTSKPIDLSIQTSGKYYYYKELRITEFDMHAIVKRLKDPKLNLLVKRTENIKFIQDVTFIASVPLFVSGLYLYETNRPVRQRRGRTQKNTYSQQQAQKTGVELMISALTCDIISISFMFDKRKHNHIVVNAYNKVIAVQ